MRPRLALLLALLLLPWTAGPEAAGPQRPKFRAVLVAGDGSLEVWDRGIEKLKAGLLAADAVVPGQLVQFSARAQPPDSPVRRAEIGPVLDAIAAMKPAKGEACLVYLTMHGTKHEGLFFEASNQHLTPEALDAALTEGCGEAPTFVVASGCYSGAFASGPMARRNRVVLTAARRDLPSFGCHASFDVTVFDGCMVYALGSAAANPVALNARLGSCVETMEERLGAPPSHPQAWLGTGVPRLVPAFRPPARS